MSSNVSQSPHGSQRTLPQASSAANSANSATMGRISVVPSCNICKRSIDASESLSQLACKCIFHERCVKNIARDELRRYVCNKCYQLTLEPTLFQNHELLTAANSIVPIELQLTPGSTIENFIEKNHQNICDWAQQITKTGPLHYEGHEYNYPKVIFYISSEYKKKKRAPNNGRVGSLEVNFIKDITKNVSNIDTCVTTTKNLLKKYIVFFNVRRVYIDTLFNKDSQCYLIDVTVNCIIVSINGTTKKIDVSNVINVETMEFDFEVLNKALNSTDYNLSLWYSDYTQAQYDYECHTFTSQVGICIDNVPTGKACFVSAEL